MIAGSIAILRAGGHFEDNEQKKGSIKNMKHRIMLSPATVEDIGFIVDVKTDVSLWPYEDDIATDRDAVCKNVTERLDGRWYKQYLIRLNTGQRTSIGAIHAHWYVKERKSWEIGYCIFPEYRGHGYCTEAAQIILKYAFEEWHAHKVVAMCNEFNIPSHKVLEKLGMTREGVFREELPWQDKWVSQYFYSILDREYQKGSVSSNV
jgi:RimJ/RimL family protein N-acetyltransferase